MDIDLELIINRSVRNNKRKIFFTMNTQSDACLACQSDQLTKSEMEIAIAFLRDCADAVESELNNKHFITH